MPVLAPLEEPRAPVFQFGRRVLQPRARPPARAGKGDPGQATQITTVAQQPASPAVPALLERPPPQKMQLAEWPPGPRGKRQLHLRKKVEKVVQHLQLTVTMRILTISRARVGPSRRHAAEATCASSAGTGPYGRGPAPTCATEAAQKAVGRASACA